MAQRAGQQASGMLGTGSYPSNYPYFSFLILRFEALRTVSFSTPINIFGRFETSAKKLFERKIVNSVQQFFISQKFRKSSRLRVADYLASCICSVTAYR